ncbi:MAG: TolC family protein [Proteobacteria bacterium]|nr:TolC family protein [Pseudomonadota bacterium]
MLTNIIAAIATLDARINTGILMFGVLAIASVCAPADAAADNTLHSPESSALARPAADNYGVADLLDVFQQALQNDSSLRTAQYQRKITRQNRWRALGATLPQVGTYYEYGRIDTGLPARASPAGSSDEPTPARDFSYASESHGISVSQVLFDYRAFSSFREIKSTQAVAASRLLGARAQTILRAVNFYFRQLVAGADVQLAQAELEALTVQLTRAKLRLDLGADSKISVQQIQARHDQARARAIIANNDYLNARNQLWALTQNYYDHLASAKEKPPLHSYSPGQIDHWIRTALTTNPQVTEALAKSEQARYHRRRINANYWPRINFNYSYGLQNISGTDQFEALFPEGTNSRASIRIDFPLFTGGDSIAQSRIAAYEFQSSRENEQMIRRQVENEVVQLWNNHNALRAALDAREAALVSSATSLDLVQQGQALGSNSTSDVLDSVRDHYRARRDFVVAIYDYLYNQARFEAATGRLSTQTIMRLNSYLQP